MKKRLFLIAPIIIACLLLCVADVHAEDLPIDINAIGRQDIREGQPISRVIVNLFTAESQMINEGLAERIYRRNSIASYLFTEIPAVVYVDPNALIMDAAYNLALFSQPTSFNVMPPPPPSSQISMWFIVLIIAFGAMGGFVWALISKRKKEAREKSVY